jgi:hypothetical protein
MTLALEQLEKLGIPRQLEASYSREDAVAVLRGQAKDPAAIDAVHAKLALNAGAQLLNLLIKDAEGLEWLRDRIACRTLLFGESSASFLSFPDDSHAILVSRALQESLVGMANILVYLDVSTGLANTYLRRRKRRRASEESVGRVSGALRYLLLGQRMTGRAPRTPAALDEESFQFAGRIAVGAVMFVIAHEIAHIVHGHTESSTRAYREKGGASISEAQELQADSWALNLLMRLFDIDSQEAPGGMQPSEVALWSAFTAIFATQITEKAIYVRRSRTHPEAWARWAVLEKQVPGSEERADSLRLAFMMSAAGAMKFDERFPDDLWPLLWSDPMLGIDEVVDLATLESWDRLNTGPLDELVSDTEPMLTSDGQTLVGALREGSIAGGLSRIGVPDPRLARILDPSLALEFSTLKGVVEKTSPALTSGDPDAFAVVAARLAATHLEGGFNP